MLRPGRGETLASSGAKRKSGPGRRQQPQLVRSRHLNSERPGARLDSEAALRGRPRRPANCAPLIDKQQLGVGVRAGKVRFSSPSGETEEVELPAGATMWRDAEEHSAENVGTSELRSLLFELK